ncbi:MAG: SMC-Scp complex subunit ScpB [Pirellulaceae bacterium]
MSDHSSDEDRPDEELEPSVNPDDEHDEDEFTLDDLSAAYAEAMVEAGLAPEPPTIDPNELPADHDEQASVKDSEEPSVEETPPTPEGVVEAALFIGHPENKPLTSKEIARVMRDVSPKEVESIIAGLNECYVSNGHAMRIVLENGGYRMLLSPEVDAVRRVFYGKVREARLSQAALEILALVAYQPGISAGELADQRGRDCGPLLNQLVRRRLLEVTREKAAGESRAVPRYHPTQRFLNLFGLSDLDDLPQVDESIVQM